MRSLKRQEAFVFNTGLLADLRSCIQNPQNANPAIFSKNLKPNITNVFRLLIQIISYNFASISNFNIYLKHGPF